MSGIYVIGVSPRKFMASARNHWRCGSSATSLSQNAAEHPTPSGHMDVHGMGLAMYWAFETFVRELSHAKYGTLLVIAVALGVRRLIYTCSCRYLSTASQHSGQRRTTPAQGVAGAGDNVFLKADDLDNRLRLVACPTPLETFLPNAASIGNRVTAGVRCTQGTQWTVYVPISIESEVSVVVLNKALARNATISAQDIEIRVQRIQGLGSKSIKSAAELSGQRLKRDLPARTVLTPGMFEPDIVIKRGQQVTVVASVAGIEVRTQGVALGDASANSRIRVKNLNSAKVVEGLVDNHNMVRVDL
jgi:flagella basal body P-ring formation protein FlgA